MLRKTVASLILALSLLTATAQPQYEFRGVWIASVENIDWPLPRQYNPEEQRKEFIRQLDMHQRNGMNAVIVQIRPSSDAFYPSPYEPWSQWLTGVQGKAPVPYWDPLQFMIEEAHKRGFEFHAWLNPYRANSNIGRASIAPNHITRLHPEWFLEYGGKLYFDPGNKQGQHWVTDVVRDIVSRYDVDAIHMDDYFYPYRVPGKEFPDSKSYALYGNGLSKADWRRSNTDSIIVTLNKAIKETKPWVKFGISPFGVWRNKSQDPMGSPTQGGLTNYDDLYADILSWTRNGWIDYVIPQLYWEMGHPKVAFETLIDWWSQHTYGRHMYIGHGIYRALEKNSKAWHNPDQLPRQLQVLRQTPNIHGSAYFSSRSFNSNPNGWNDSLQNNYYRTPALIPPMEWLPAKPGTEAAITLKQ